MKKTLVRVSFWGAAMCVAVAAAAGALAWRAMRDVYRELHRYDEASDAPEEE